MRGEGRFMSDVERINCHEGETRVTHVITGWLEAAGKKNRHNVTKMSEQFKVQDGYKRESRQ